MDRDIAGEINFYSHTKDGVPPSMVVTLKSNWLVTNYVLLPTQVTIQDLQGKEHTVYLDTNGFEIRKSDGDILDVYDDHSQIQRCYEEEIFFIKIFDSDPDVAQFGAHTAFIDQCVPSPSIEQQSIELRCLVFYD